MSSFKVSVKRRERWKPPSKSSSRRFSLSFKIQALSALGYRSCLGELNERQSLALRKQIRAKGLQKKLPGLFLIPQVQIWRKNLKNMCELTSLPELSLRSALAGVLCDVACTSLAWVVPGLDGHNLSQGPPRCREEVMNVHRFWGQGASPSVSPVSLLTSLAGWMQH